MDILSAENLQIRNQGHGTKLLPQLMRAMHQSEFIPACGDVAVATWGATLRREFQKRLAVHILAVLLAFLIGCFGALILKGLTAMNHRVLTHKDPLVFIEL